jgi:hypothetical protein
VSAPVHGRKRARPTAPSVREQSRNWTNFELLAAKAHAQSQSSTRQRLTIAAGRPDIGTGARPLLPDGRARIERQDAPRALVEQALFAKLLPPGFGEAWNRTVAEGAPKRGLI